MNTKEKLFVETVWEYYKRHGRRGLPWRRTRDLYRVLVSEIMLQQTQVERVIPKYRSFLKRFPSIHALADATLGEVLREWQGLGYNRRAKMLHECASAIVENRRGRGAHPMMYEELTELPGVGPYTAGAICAFAYNTPTPIIETNIRTVYLHHFFKKQTEVHDKEVFRLIERTLDTKNPREWYYALMDYGAFLKKEIGNQNQRSRHHAKQSAFKGSNREVRGQILRILAIGGASEKKLIGSLTLSGEKVRVQLETLMREGMIVKKGRTYTLPS